MFEQKLSLARWLIFFVGLFLLTLGCFLAGVYAGFQYNFYGQRKVALQCSQQAVVLTQALLAVDKDKLKKEMDKLEQIIASSFNYNLSRKLQIKFKPVKKQVNDILFNGSVFKKTLQTVQALSNFELHLANLFKPTLARYHYRFFYPIVSSYLEETSVPEILTYLFLNDYNRSLGTNLNVVSLIKSEFSPWRLKFSLKPVYKLDLNGLKLAQTRYGQTQKLWLKLWIGFWLASFLGFLVLGYLRIVWARKNQNLKLALSALVQGLSGASCPQLELNTWKEFEQEVEKLGKTIEQQCSDLVRLKRSLSELALAKSLSGDNDFQTSWGQDSFVFLEKIANNFALLSTLIDEINSCLKKGTTNLALSYDLRSELPQNIRMRIDSTFDGLRYVEIVHKFYQSMFKQFQIGDVDFEQIKKQNFSGYYGQTVNSFLDTVVYVRKRMYNGLKELQQELEQKKQIRWEKYQNVSKCFQVVQDILTWYEHNLTELRQKIREYEELFIFKRTIEDDRLLSSVHMRIKKLLSERFQIDRFVFLAVNSSENIIEKEIMFPDDSFYCDQKILHFPDLCRCKRLGKLVLDERSKLGQVCPYFTEKNKFYLCQPFFIDGRVSYILQITSSDYKRFLTVKKNLKQIILFLGNIIDIFHVKKMILKGQSKNNLN